VDSGRVSQSNIFLPSSSQRFHYSVQTDQQRKKGGGLGRSELSYWKHDEIEKFMNRQLPVIKKKGMGCIIDMNAGDGKETPHPQPDLFAGGSLKTTPTMAIHYARKHGSDVILCEKNKDRRLGLIKEYSSLATIIGNNKSLIDSMKDRIIQYQWLLVINDPNGYGDQSIDIMKHLANAVPVSDFIIVFNVHSLVRPMGLAKNPENANHSRHSVRASYRSGIDSQWMMDDNEWKSRLEKKKIMTVGPRRISAEMNAKIMLISNFIPGMK